MRPFSLATVLSAVLLTSTRAASLDGRGKKHSCPPFQNGTFIIHQYQLYPDNAAFDFDECVLYISALFNGSMVKYDPYTGQTLDIINFPGISDVYDEHASGIHWDPRTKDIYLVIDAQPAFLTDGANATGDYWLIKYSTTHSRELHRTNLTALTQSLYAGFQDVTTDSHGNAYVVGTYPSSIIRVSPSGVPTLFYPPQTSNTSVHGFTGIVSLPTTFSPTTLIAISAEGVPEELSAGDSKLYRFDTSLKYPPSQPTIIPISPPETKLGVPDAIHLPERYGGTVMLAAMNYVGVSVLRSKDGWRSAEYLGTIPSDYPKFFERIITATVQIGAEKQFMIGQSFPGGIVPGTKGGNGTDFPFFDITDEVEALLGY
ncbi:hypothetical protein QBC47DRAFT_462692 [Echria macrotheca]|uniref:Tri14-like protein n=1 Tax=Echria macrotheca TaxID=438768 RepID=A0AAJ0F9C8_9PEZI|nr:hypothetical protein QBC47DRAFT_462692 [Echria macrotheca]